MQNTLVIFGITGDLAQSKLIPAVQNLVKNKKVKKLKVVGLSRRPLERKVNLPDFEHILTDFNDPKVFASLNKLPNAIYYLALPPEAYKTVVSRLVVSRGDKILVEKPYGKDLRDTQKVYKALLKNFKPNQIYFVDHYLGKESVQKLGRQKFDPKKIQRVELNFLETARIGHRAKFFDATGAFRDFGQNHLLQILAKIIGKKNLNQLELAKDPSDERGQYKEYQQEIGKPSETETSFHLTARTKKGKWKNIPLVLTNGKGMPEQKNEVTVHYKNGRSKTFAITNGGYENVLLYAIKNSREIFPTVSEIGAQWKFTEKALRRLKKLPLENY
jgi:glucose-6-phosphate 1-dehydrogenase